MCSGGKDTFVPRFTYHGFRYVSIAGMGGNPPLDAFTALVLGTDAAATAQFSCSSPLVNRLWANIVWGQRSNFVDVPTDCPQRDERLAGPVTLLFSAAPPRRMRTSTAFSASGWPTLPLDKPRTAVCRTSCRT